MALARYEVEAKGNGFEELVFKIEQLLHRTRIEWGIALEPVHQAQRSGLLLQLHEVDAEEVV